MNSNKSEGYSVCAHPYNPAKMESFEKEKDFSHMVSKGKFDQVEGSLPKSEAKNLR